MPLDACPCFFTEIFDQLLCGSGHRSHVIDRTGAGQQQVAFDQVGEPEIRRCLEQFLDPAQSGSHAILGDFLQAFDQHRFRSGHRCVLRVCRIAREGPGNCEAEHYGGCSFAHPGQRTGHPDIHETGRFHRPTRSCFISHFPSFLTISSILEDWLLSASDR